MDSLEIARLIHHQSPSLKQHYYGVVSYDKMHHLPPGKFQIVNTLDSNSDNSQIGHWVLVARLVLDSTTARTITTTTTTTNGKLMRRRMSKKKKKKKMRSEDAGGIILFYDSFGRPLRKHFPRFYNKLLTIYKLNANNVHADGIISQYFPTQSFLQSGHTSLCGLYCVFCSTYNVQHSIFQIRSQLLKLCIRRRRRKVRK